MSLCVLGEKYWEVFVAGPNFETRTYFWGLELPPKQLFAEPASSQLPQVWNPGPLRLIVDREDPSNCISCTRELECTGSSWALVIESHRILARVPYNAHTNTVMQNPGLCTGHKFGIVPGDKNLETACHASRHGRGPPKCCPCS